MPISFKQINSIPDIMNSERFMVMIPNLPGGGTGEKLTIRNVDVTLPPMEVAQILVKILGWTLAFAGRRIQQNSLTMSFYEDSAGTVTNALAKWQDACAGFVNAGGLLKKDYTRDFEVKAFDSTGKAALVFHCNNCWPMRITHPQLSSDSNAPYRVDVDMSIDSVDLLGITDEGNQTAFTDSYRRVSDLGGFKTSPISQVQTGNLPFQIPQLNMSVGSSYSLMNSVLGMNLNGSLSLGPNGLSVQGGLTGLGGALGINVRRTFGF